MIGLVLMPSSMASRVRSGRQSIAMRSSCAGLCRLLTWSSPSRLGLRPLAGPQYEHRGSARPPQCLRYPRGADFMRLGLSVGYWGLGLSNEDQLSLVKEVEALGYDSVWTAEAYGSDAATGLAWLAAHTERIKLGSAIFQMPGRSPAM